MYDVRVKESAPTLTHTHTLYLLFGDTFVFEFFDFCYLLRKGTFLLHPKLGFVGFFFWVFAFGVDSFLFQNSTKFPN